MFLAVLGLLANLLLILVACSLFVNAVEWVGKRLDWHQGIVGGIVAAIGTALPETLVPIIAIFWHGGTDGMEVGVGAIAGAPFMLGTLALCVTGATAVALAWAGKRSGTLTIDQKQLRKDLLFFMGTYGIAVATTWVHSALLRTIIALCILVSYGFYLHLTIRHKGLEVEEPEVLWVSRWCRVPNSMFWIWVQLLGGLGLILFAANGFVGALVQTAHLAGWSPLILSILLTPIATELPEKINSILWVRKRQDVLALGNITGAMVFQSCFPVAFGMIFTPWELSGLTLLSAGLTLGSALFLWLWVSWRKDLPAWLLLLGGVAYAVFVWQALH